MAVRKYGLRSRVRGGENILVATLMLERQGPGCGSMMSIHNQRFWRDMFMGCVYYFYTLFRHLEESSLCFAEGWCHHQIRTEKNRTPLQLWISGSMARRESRLQDDYLLSEVATGWCDSC